MVEIPIRIGRPALLPHQAGGLESTGVHLPQTLQPAVIGVSPATSELVGIGDRARRSGLYILGGPATGKTEVLKRLILSDIGKGHGVFFLDPHADAIGPIIDSMGGSGRTSDVMLLDPTDNFRTFGINLLRCDDMRTPAGREDAYNRCYGVFERLWRDDFGPWLQLILGNTIRVFIESPGYTLADVPLFFEDAAFRECIIGNVKYNTSSVNYWRHSFETLSHRDKTAKIDATLTRLYILLASEFVRGVVGQAETTVDFSSIMRDKKIVFLNLPAHLPEDDKRFLGTIIVSELLHAAMHRPSGDRSHFSIFVDEFQNFASSRDFGLLITEARKFGIAATVAHQERFGQFSDDKRIQGATAVAENKVAFRLSVRDAQELAPEFAEKPPVEIKRERELVISQEPVTELLRGHKNPWIRDFVNAYLRELDDRRLDSREALARTRIIRDDLRDESMLSRLDAQIESLDAFRRDLHGQERALVKAERYADAAHEQTGGMLDLFDAANGLRITLRRLNRFFTAIMEGRLDPEIGNEDFSDFLIERIRQAPGVPGEREKVLELYIALSCGEPRKKRAIPFSFAAKYKLFEGKRESVLRTLEHERHVKVKGYLSRRWWSKRRTLDADESELARQIRADVKEWEFAYAEDCIYDTGLLGTGYILYTGIEEVKTLLSQFTGCRFAPEWREKLPDLQSLIRRRIDELGDLSDASEEYRSFVRKAFLREPVVAESKAFLKRYSEGALVVSELISQGQDHLPYYGKLWHSRQRNEYKYFSLRVRPAVDGMDRLTQLKLIIRLNRILLRHMPLIDLFMDKTNFNNYFRTREEPRISKGEINKKYYEDYCDKARIWTNVREFDVGELGKRDDLKLLAHLLKNNMERVERIAKWDVEKWWSSLEEVEQLYLLSRACDISYLDLPGANRTWPQPAMSGKSEKQITDFLMCCVHLVRENEKESDEKGLLGMYNEMDDEGDYDFPRTDDIREYALIKRPDPEHLEARTLSGAEREDVLSACLKELEGDRCLRVINDFITFCRLLKRPENHIQVPSGQYKESEVNSRTSSDMAGEMVQTLSGLPRHVAYAKVMQEDAGGGVSMFTGRIQTLQLPALAEDDFAEAARKARWLAIETGRYRYMKRRDEVEEEIRARQARWRVSVSSERPPLQCEDGPEEVSGAKAHDPEPDGPPPLFADGLE